MGEFIHEAFEIDGILVEVDATPEARPDRRIAHGVIDQQIAELHALRSELDARPVGPDSKEFDAFRLQTTRNITTLQTQVQNLQQQISAGAR